MAAGDKRDYYQILGVARDADADAIKNAFRNQALKYHPDRNKSADAEDKFKESAEAYAVLSDPKKRQQYDTGGFSGVGAVSADDIFSNINLGDLFGGPGVGFDLGGDLFGNLFRRRRAGPQKGRDIQVRFSVPLDVVYRGGEHTVRYSHQVQCESCSGSGAAAGTSPSSCAGCKGTGRVVSTRKGRRDDQNVVFQQVSVCSECGGRGIKIDRPCSACAGRGQTEREENLKIKIPPGVSEGMALRVPGRGMPADEPGQPPGDFYAIVHADYDARFERHGADLWRAETIDVVDAVLGTRLEIPALDGKLSVTVPPGVQSGEVLRLRGQGLPVFQQATRGDLNVRVEVHVPTELADEERALYEKLRDLNRSDRPD